MKRFLMRLVCLPVIAAVFAVVLGALASPSAAQAAPVVSAPAVQLVVQSTPVVAPAATAAAKHTVVKGDRLGEIAAKHNYPGGWKALHGCNRDVIGSNPHRIKPGMVLNLAPCSNPSAGSDERSDDPEPRPQADSGNSRGIAVWDRLAQCESSGNWKINTGNGYYGGVQFSLKSWRYVGGEGYPHKASKAEQIARAKKLLVEQGWSRGWPGCTRKLGLDAGDKAAALAA